MSWQDLLALCQNPVSCLPSAHITLMKLKWNLEMLFLATN